MGRMGAEVVASLKKETAESQQETLRVEERLKESQQENAKLVEQMVELRRRNRELEGK